jgi:hypothetical protein
VKVTMFERADKLVIGRRRPVEQTNGRRFIGLPRLQTWQASLHPSRYLMTGA